MTGQKNRFKTFEKMAGLDDKQLKTPKHDEMVIWLLKWDNLIKVIPEVSNWIDLIDKAYDKDYNFIKDEVKRIKNRELNYYNNDYVLKKLNEFLKLPLPKIKIISEIPIKGNNNFIMGYWDIVVEIGSIINDIVRTFVKIDIQSDSKLNELYNNRKVPDRIYIEVKPKIDSFGSTLRQLNTYKSLVPYTSENVYLFTEDLRFKDDFETQDIKVISPPERQSQLDL